jgi:GT2 family glycosyltransferase/tetratricopeptide (TPR) repeat protein
VEQRCQGVSGEPVEQVVVVISSPASIIIVTYNSAATIGLCLSSVLTSLRRGDSVVIVDNNSGDATLEIVATLISPHAPGMVNVIANPTNRGFSVASNQGIMATVSPLIVLLNPDTVVTTGWLERMAAHFASNKVGAVGPVSNFAVGRQSVLPHWQGERPASIGPQEAAELLYGWKHGTSETSRLLIGFCLMLRRDIVVQVGGLDERLFLGNDDLELSWRLRAHGFELRIAADVFIYHEGQHSFRGEPESLTSRLTQESSDTLYRILELHYGSGRVPTPQELWGIDWLIPSFGEFNPRVQFHQILIPPRCVLQRPECQPLVSIVILTFNQRRYTEECLAALERHTPEPYEVILVDNGSHDGTVTWLESMAAANPRYRLISNNVNRGFAAGCNQGLAEARGEYLVLLNNDVVVTPEWISGLMECHRAESRVGIVGPLTNNSSGIQGLGNVERGGMEGLDAFAREFRIRHRYRRVSSRRLVGFCMLFSRQVYQEVGGLDERFGTGNFEDDDYCLRAAIAGYRNLIAGDVYVHHHGSVSFAGASIDYRAALTGNWALFREKWSCPVEDKALAQRIAACRVREDAERLLMEDRLIEALGLLAAACRDHVNDPQLRQLLCNALQYAGRYDDALSLISPDSAAGLTIRARGLMVEGRDAEAESMLTSALMADPGYGGAYLLRGYLAQRREEDEFFATLIMKGFELAPLVPDHVLAVKQIMDSSWLSQLLTLLEETVHLHPHSRILARLHAELASCAGDDQRVVAAAERFVEVFGPDERVLELGVAARRVLGSWRLSAPRGRSVSLCMIVRDEERHIVRCLASCRPLVHEMVVVDTGSQDHTASLAELMGARLVHHPWRDDFAEARNVSLAAATGDWILVLDGDEALSARDYQIFQNILAETAHPVAFSLTSRNYTTDVTHERFTLLDGSYPEEEAGFGWSPSEKVRLFPNNLGIRFRGVVHELVEESVTRARLSILSHPVPVHHYGSLDCSKPDRRNKGVIYYEMGLRKLQEGNRDPKAIYELAVQAGGMGRFQEAEALWLEFLEKNIGVPVAWFNLGYLYLRMGQVEDARVATEQALSLKPDYSAALANLAICRFCQMPPEEALAVVGTIAEACPDYVSLEGLLNLAICLNGQAEDAIAGLGRLAARGYDMKEYIASLLVLLRNVGRFREAEILEALIGVLA